MLKELSKLNPMDLFPVPPALTERYTGLTMGEHAEEMAQNFGIRREDQDALAMESHQKAAAATKAGLLADEIMTVQTPRGPVSADNLIRGDMDAGKLAKLKPVFDRKNGTITAATSSALTDGAACCLLMRESKAKELGLKPMGFVRSWAFAGQDPRENMLLGNVYSSPVALDRAGLTMADMQEFPVGEYGKAMAAVGEGKIDASIFCVGCAAAKEAAVNLASHGGLRYLPIPDTPEALAAIRKILPGAYTKVFQPSPATPGVNVPTRLMVYSVFLTASTHTSDDVVYKTVKALHDNKETLAASAAVMKTFDPAMMAEANAVPYHPGAEKFYKEIGEWPPIKR